MASRWQANSGIIAPETLKRIQACHVLLVGAGGLGGHVANSLVRLGLRRLTIVDPDVFETSNLNRQLFCDEKTLGKPKAKVVADALKRIDQSVDVTPRVCRVETLDVRVLNDVDWVFDAVDTIQVKLWLEQLATRLNVPLVHGAIGGWYGQFAICAPRRFVLEKLYGTYEAGLEKTLGSPTFTPAIIANCMVAEWVKCVQKPKHTMNTVFIVDMANWVIDVLVRLDEEV